ncbi:MULTISPECIES: NADPH-dependent FMN reductase [unclassified Undibacterium]|uniref:NADPH-dependent FMN reductase n=1 Tax=unclassified Undibacterium TaxID=2630295 RepID=UPI002AC91BC5|nr:MULTISPECIES: NADPH-dependent FMN reductase [unclassified Undibacterium]MEB0139005.1 NADPH-dependent FMN reductase [Undibacterium sp. CCC2.1]MEB0171900.1 NADPH-dependent FMN reductase [Undibacterium sp. CCC1.1]MEB0175841.1 NADPH-dependent FMN reductase [Undibacterium sp. CCC3.4]MEB0215093.1 NADPH-dependent FMN reductase [Undibacterium sp. 5I2]WPX45063.1 NADPH-dependent FMN reductase [Undibacterium sp. CCC3.4]
MSILLLSGSPAAVSRSHRLLQHIGDKLQLLGQQCVSLQVRDLPAQALLHADFSNLELLAAQRLLAQAEAIVIATHIYKASFSGLLKTFLDLLPQDGLDGKLILPIATGGSQSHMLALDYGLRPVLATLAARQVLPAIYATDAEVVWSDEHGLQLAQTIAERVQKGVVQLLQNLPSSATNSHASDYPALVTYA